MGSEWPSQRLALLRVKGVPTAAFFHAQPYILDVLFQSLLRSLLLSSADAGESADESDAYRSAHGQGEQRHARQAQDDDKKLLGDGGGPALKSGASRTISNIDRGGGMKDFFSMVFLTVFAFVFGTVILQGNIWGGIAVAAAVIVAVQLGKLWKRFWGKHPSRGGGESPSRLALCFCHLVPII